MRCSSLKNEKIKFEVEIKNYPEDKDDYRQSPNDKFRYGVAKIDCPHKRIIKRKCQYRFFHFFFYQLDGKTVKTMFSKKKKVIHPGAQIQNNNECNRRQK